MAGHAAESATARKRKVVNSRRLASVLAISARSHWWDVSPDFCPRNVLLLTCLICVIPRGSSEDQVPPFSHCDGALWESEMCSGEGEKDQSTSRPTVLLVDSTFNDLHGVCGCAMREGDGSCSEWPGGDEGKGDLRPYDWVVFGLVERSKFSLRHSRCPLLASKDNHQRQEGGLRVDAMVFTDREIQALVNGSTAEMLEQSPWQRRDHVINIHKAVLPPSSPLLLF